MRCDFCERPAFARFSHNNLELCFECYERLKLQEWERAIAEDRMGDGGVP